MTVNTSDLVVDTANNRVGIGTSSPSFVLDVTGATADVAKFKRSSVGTTEVLIDTAGSGDAQLVFADNGTDSYAIGRDNTNGDFVIAASGAVGTSNLINIESGGNVGIGTSTIGYRLDLESASGTDHVLNVRNPSTSWGEYALARFQTDTKDTRFIDLGYYRGLSEPERAFIINGQSSNRLFTILESSGNVGIGTSSFTSNSPTIKEVAIKNTTTNGLASYRLSTTDNGLGASMALSSYLDENALIFGLQTSFTETSSSLPTERMRIDSSGNVGIGTSTGFGGKLDVTISTDARGYFSNNIGEVGAGNFALQVVNSAGSALKPLGFRAEDIRFATGSSERLRILGNNLHLNGGADCRIQLGSGGAGANSTSNNTVHIRGDNTSLKFMAASGGDIIFEQNGTSRFVFGTNDWYFGNYTNATETLNFRTSSNGTTKFNFYDANSTEGCYIKHTGQTYGAKIIYGARWDDDEDWMAIDLRQSSSGGGYDCKVGIGTTTPEVPLVIQVSASQANAEMRFQSGTATTDHFKLYANQAGRFYVQNVSTSSGVYLQHNANAWTSASDERLKENIVELDNVLPKISNLRAVKYNFISDEENTTKIGFIAQDWQTDFSEVVSDSIPEELGINYTETIPVLLKAIQEQQVLIEQLQAEVALLKGE